MRVLILYGAVAPDAPPDEQDVLVEVAAVGDALTRLGHEVHCLALTLDIHTARVSVLRIAPEVVFNLVESVEGQGTLIHLGTVLLDTLGIPYTGAGVSGMALSSDKPVAKRVLRRAGFLTPDWVESAEPNAVADPKVQYIVKSVAEHASIGLDDHSVMPGHAVAQALAARGPGWFAEAYIEGREFNVALLEGAEGPEVLPISEIHFENFPPGKPRIVGYSAKWDENTFEYQHTPRYFPAADAEAGLLAQLAELSLRIWQCFEQHGYARVDFRVDVGGKPYVLEVNANPCIAPDAGFDMAIHQAGLAYDEAIRRIVEAALRRFGFRSTEIP